MALSYTHFQAFLRCMLQNDGMEWETDVELVRRKVEFLLRARFETLKEQGSTVISSSIGGDSFAYRINANLSDEGIIEAATKALELIDTYNPVSRPGFSALSAADQKQSHLNAIEWLKLCLKRVVREQNDYTYLRH